MPCSLDLPNTSPDNSICSPPETIQANNRAFCAHYLLPSPHIQLNTESAIRSLAFRKSSYVR
jgi:hypothetical protein